MGKDNSTALKSILPTMFGIHCWKIQLLAQCIHYTLMDTQRDASISSEKCEIACCWKPLKLNLPICAWKGSNAEIFSGMVKMIKILQWAISRWEPTLAMIEHGSVSETERLLVNNEVLIRRSLLKIQSTPFGNIGDLWVSLIPTKRYLSHTCTHNLPTEVIDSLFFSFFCVHVAYH